MKVSDRIVIVNHRGLNSDSERGEVMNFHENEKVELKEIYQSSVTKEIIAFANANGGKIYIGVSDVGEVSGVDEADSVMQQISNSLRDSIKPDIMMFVEVKLLEIQDKSVVEIDVEEGARKPYYLSNKGLKPSGVYIRSGTTSSPVTDDMIRRMIKLSDGDSFELNRSMLQNLTFDTLFSEFKKRELPLEEIQMKNLGVVTSDGVYTNMGLLVSDQNKHTIKVAVFEGQDKSRFKDRREFEGSVFKQMLDVYQFIDIYNATKASFENLIRTDSRDYSEDAIREALLNAIVHRDYSFSGSTLINVFSNRLEVISLGGLVPGLSIEAAKIGASQPRNERLANLFYRLRLIEAYGTGISKIISSYKHTKLEPEFHSVDGAFVVILPNMNAENEIEHKSTKLHDGESPLIGLFEERDEIVRRDVERALNIKTTQALKIINELVEENVLIKVGVGKNTRYRMNKSI